MPFSRLAGLLKSLPKPYRAKDFERREIWRAEYRHLASLLLAQLDFDSVLDVGCANGFLLEEFRLAGKRFQGIELSPAVAKVLSPELLAAVRVGDFSAAAGSWDLVCCVEMAEHIRPPRSFELVETLTARSRKWIYFTAAPPGQGGHGHINCRPHREWLAWFRGMGFPEDEFQTARLRAGLEALNEATWLRENSFVLRRSGEPGRA